VRKYIIVLLFPLLTAYIPISYSSILYGLEIEEAENYGLNGFAEPSEEEFEASLKPTILYEEIDLREAGLEIFGNIPILVGYIGETAINRIIETAIENRIAHAREIRARTLTFAFEHYIFESYMSIVITSVATAASSRTDIMSVNFNTLTGEIVNVADIFGSHIVQLVDSLLIDALRTNPGHFNSSFGGMRENQAFSAVGSEIIFFFNDYELVSGAQSAVALQLDNMREITLTPEEYHIREGFNLKMIPLGLVVSAMGYEANWHYETNEITLHYNGELVISMTPDVNSYVREGRFARSLEVAPVILDGVTFVPISFFNQVLSLITFHIDDYGNITFISYSSNLTF